MFNKRRKIIIPVLVFLTTIITYQVVLATTDSDNLYKQVKLLTTIIDRTVRNYVDPIDYEKMIQGGIKGALKTLDPHTVYFEKKQYDNLKMETKGEFGGLGIVIGMRDEILTVISPMEGTPAHRMGIRAGDQIIKIEEKSTKGFNTEDAVELLRGEPGTDVTITIKRYGEPKPLEYTITRDIIEIKSVPYYGVTEEGIGYIRLAHFSEKAAGEVRSALESFEEQNVKGVILDLRSNPGGLLNQAIRVSSLFLDDEDLIVYTKGNASHRNTRANALPSDVKYSDGNLIVLVNGGSASASEIVSGAIQDHDRGLIMGQRTFGKGLVQTVLPLTEGTALKVTTAKYYIPSGRCIQKEDYLKSKYSSIISEFSDDTTDTDEADFTFDDYEETVDSSETNREDLPEYETSSGRTVYGGGGITPDVDFDPERMTPLEIALERKSIFFGYALDYVSKYEDAIKSPEDVVISKEVMDEFMKYLDDQEFEFELRAESEIEKLEKLLEDAHFKSEIESEIADLRSVLDKEKEAEFDRSDDFIKMAIRREIISNKFGQDARYAHVVIKEDKEIQRAIEILLDKGKYSLYFDPDHN